MTIADRRSCPRRDCLCAVLSARRFHAVTVIDLVGRCCAARSHADAGGARLAAAPRTQYPVDPGHLLGGAFASRISQQRNWCCRTMRSSIEPCGEHRLTAGHHRRADGASGADHASDPLGRSAERTLKRLGVARKSRASSQSLFTLTRRFSVSHRLGTKIGAAATNNSVFRTLFYTSVVGTIDGRSGGLRLKEQVDACDRRDDAGSE